MRLQALHPLFRAEEDAGTRDNAAGAVGRVIAAVGAQAPLEQVRWSAAEILMLSLLSHAIFPSLLFCMSFSRNIIGDTSVENCVAGAVR